MTRGQITYFYVAARCCWTKYVARSIDYVKYGDTQAWQMMVNSIAIDQMLKSINCYNPDAENNCLTMDQVLEIINGIMSMLGLCGDLNALPETTTCSCNCLETISIIPK